MNIVYVVWHIFKMHNISNLFIIPTTTTLDVVVIGNTILKIFCVQRMFLMGRFLGCYSIILIS
jgi:hypothetical protein